MQQSHHCGIETCLSEYSVDFLEWQQSHHCGIETSPRTLHNLKEAAGSNRTIVGLKLQTSLSWLGLRVGQQSHHCGIETKQRQWDTPTTHLSSNRTIVGLKQEQFTVQHGSMVEQQSHHCGIETRVRRSGLDRLSRSNRTIVGLKPLLLSILQPFVFSSNRTIVGLKPRSIIQRELDKLGSNRTIVGLKPGIAFNCSNNAWQQSHHCGIETFQRSIALTFRSTAAIAPLWD